MDSISANTIYHFVKKNYNANIEASLYSPLSCLVSFYTNHQKKLIFTHVYYHDVDCFDCDYSKTTPQLLITASVATNMFY